MRLTLDYYMGLTLGCMGEAHCCEAFYGGLLSFFCVRGCPRIKFDAK